MIQNVFKNQNTSWNQAVLVWRRLFLEEIANELNDLVDEEIQILDNEVLERQKEREFIEVEKQSQYQEAKEQREAELGLRQR